MKTLVLSSLILLGIISACYFLSERSSDRETKETIAKPEVVESVKEDGVTSEAVIIEKPQEEKVEAEKKETPEPPKMEEREPQPAKITPSPSLATEHAAYYRSVRNLANEQLKAGLHKLIRGHRVLTYGELWEALRDLDHGEAGNVVLIYDRTQRSHALNGGDQGDWNREHLWPRAYGVRRSSPANTDLHHIRASDVGINGKRGHLYFDETQGEDYGGKKYSFDSDSWEPPNEVKGDIARAMFYMAVRYEGDEANSVDLELSDTPSLTQGVHGKLTTLKRWHRQDPVSAEEKQRNNKIHRSYQGNRNPFIDHADWVERSLSNHDARGSFLENFTGNPANTT